MIFHDQRPGFDEWHVIGTGLSIVGVFGFAAVAGGLLALLYHPGLWVGVGAFVVWQLTVLGRRWRSRQLPTIDASDFEGDAEIAALVAEHEAESRR